jgi:gamma-F420-2:alpha-L-glutamate ligase
MCAAAAAGLPIPKTMVLSAKEGIIEWDTFPVVLKLPIGSCGAGVIIIDKPSRLKAVVDMLKEVDLKRTPIILQEYLGDRPGVDVRVIVVGGRALGAMERVARSGEDRANLAQGGEGKPVELTAEMAAVAERITEVLGLAFAGVDLLYKRDHYAIAEVNSSPGLKFETICKINVAGKIAECPGSAPVRQK